MGWLGWSEGATLDATMTGILTAYKGRVGMLEAIFGTGQKKPPAMTPLKPGDLTKALRFVSGGQS